jgi:hypothetical protein
MGVMVSPLKGADGNVEFLVHLRAHDRGAGLGAAELEAALDDVVRSAGAPS